MYLERVYRLQVEFCEVSQLLSRAQTLELQDQLSRRRTEIIAAASDLIHLVDAGSELGRVPARSSPQLETVSSASY
jgi:hypothetical protein